MMAYPDGDLLLQLMSECGHTKPTCQTGRFEYLRHEFLVGWERKTVTNPRLVPEVLQEAAPYCCPCPL